MAITQFRSPSIVRYFLPSVSAGVEITECPTCGNEPILCMAANSLLYFGTDRLKRAKRGQDSRPQWPKAAEPRCSGTHSWSGADNFNTKAALVYQGLESWRICRTRRKVNLALQILLREAIALRACSDIRKVVLLGDGCASLQSSLFVSGLLAACANTINVRLLCSTRGPVQRCTGVGTRGMVAVEPSCSGCNAVALRGRREIYGPL